LRDRVLGSGHERGAGSGCRDRPKEPPHRPLLSSGSAPRRRSRSASSCSTSLAI
jgi:hypothetical protein